MTQVSFDRVAAVYDSFMGRWTHLFAPALLDAADLAPGQRVLDLATGTGECALLAAARVGPRGRVVGADISLPMLRAARGKVGARPIRLMAADAQALACRGESFDRVVAQLGLMFFPDPLAGAREARRVLRPGGRFAALVWSAAERVPWFNVLARELVEHLPGRRDELFVGSRLGAVETLERVFTAAGLRDVRVARQTQPMEFASFEAYWSYVEDGAIRIGTMLRELPGATAAAVRDRVRAALAAFAVGERLVMPTEVLVATGTR